MNRRTLIQKLKITTKFIKEKIGNFNPIVVIILGSGLNDIAEVVEKKVILPYSKIPFMPNSSVEGHKNNLIFGYIENKPVVVMQGRIHFYEGYSLQEVTYPIRIMQQLNVKNLILTAAVGAIKGKLPLKPADIVVIKDHINLIGDNPLCGPHYKELGERFVDMSQPYDLSLIKITKNVAKKYKIKIYEGVYLAVKGPSYETKAEIFAFKKFGADVVGMSIVPEVIVANQAKINVLAICYVANLATGLSKKIISHKEVLETAKIAKNKIGKLLKGVIKQL